MTGHTTGEVVPKLKIKDPVKVLKAFGLGTSAIFRLEIRDIKVALYSDKISFTSEHVPSKSVQIPSGAISLALKGQLQPMSKQSAGAKLSSAINQICASYDKATAKKPKPDVTVKKKKKTPSGFTAKELQDSVPLKEALKLHCPVLTPYDGKPGGLHYLIAMYKSFNVAARYQAEALSIVVDGYTKSHELRLKNLGFKYVGNGLWHANYECKDVDLMQKTVGAVLFGLGSLEIQSPYPNLSHICAD